MRNIDPQNPIRSVEMNDEALVVRVHGDVDLHRSPDFQQALMALLDRRPRRIVIDLGEVPYMDSSGVASLVKFLSVTRREGIELRLCRLGDRVRSIFEITRLDVVFDIRGDLSEALTT